MNDRTIYIIDGHSQVFKAYHAIQQLSTSKGVPTNASYGFTQILHRLLNERQPKYLVVTFDSARKTFRHEMYEAYKANRTEAPDDLALQMEHIREILEALRIPILSLDGYEADDLIATISKKAQEEGYSVVVVTADKDLFQLVNENVRVLRLDPDKETEFDRNAVKEKMGVYPEQILDMLAMVGDTSDNVPGIPKVGPKTAATLLDQFGTLEAVLENTDKLKGKQRENIEAGRQSAILSKQLVTLDYEAPIDFCCDNFALEAPDVPRLARLYRELEFRRYLDDLQLPAVERKTNYRVITDLAELQQFCDEIRAAGFVSLDTETDRLDPMNSNLVGISLAVNENESIYIPIGHLGAFGSDIHQLTIEQIQPLLAPLLSDPTTRKIAHNVKYDQRVLMRYGLSIDPMSFDTLLASYLLNPDKRNHGLKELAEHYLNIKMTQITDLIGKGQKQISFADTDIAPAGQYACADADVTLQLANLLEAQLNDSGMRPLFDNIEMPLINVLIEMEETGVRINAQHFRQVGNEFARQLKSVSDRIFECVGHDFNLGSPKQVAHVLFEELQLTAGKQKKTGPSTDFQVLEELSCIHEVPRLLVEYRQLEKLKSTYIDVLPGLVNRRTGRIHTSYNQTVAATGRLSSSDPNLQNIPIRTEAGRRIREGFIPSAPENVLFAADYSQIELRVLAHVTKDESLVNAYRNNIDVHTLTASKVFGCAQEDVTYEMRDKSKMINFGIIYGMSAQGLSQRLKIPYATAKEFIIEYFKAYTGVERWTKEILQSARENGFVSTLTGRRRYLADINSRNFNARGAAERYAINAPIQGTSADMIKIAMIDIANWLRGSGLKSRMIMQVHDELIFDVPESELSALQPKVMELMKNALALDVPIEVGTGTGKTWAEC